MLSIKIGFVGFGEVASILSKTIKENGAMVYVYDVLYDTEEGKEKLKSRVKAGGIQFAPLSEVIAECDYILSTVTTQVAKNAAKKCSEYLKPGKVFVDLNSTEPSIKKEISEIIGETGAEFVEGAILGAVGATGAGTSILLGGIKGNEAEAALKRYGLNVSFYSEEVGKASTFKMLRSIFSKGLEALIIEFLIAGRSAGLTDDLWKEIIGIFSDNKFEKVASNWVQSHATACERRYYEMIQVVKTMKELGIEPLMTSAAENFFNRSASLNFKEVFTQKPETKEEVINFMMHRLIRGC